MYLLKALQTDIPNIKGVHHLNFDISRLKENLLPVGLYVNSCINSYTEITNDYLSNIVKPKVNPETIEELDRDLYTCLVILSGICDSLSIKDHHLNSYIVGLLSEKGYSEYDRDEKTVNENINLLCLVMLTRDIMGNYYHYPYKNRVIPISANYLNHIIICLAMINYHLINTLYFLSQGNNEQAQKSIVNALISNFMVCTAIKHKITI